MKFGVEVANSVTPTATITVCETATISQYEYMVLLEPHL